MKRSKHKAKVRFIILHNRRIADLANEEHIVKSADEDCELEYVLHVVIWVLELIVITVSTIRK
jgi:hypothetical protein